MAKLALNIESLAALRETAGLAEADPVQAAFLAELGGIDALICPVNEEFRPVTERDLRLLRTLTKVRFDLHLPASEKPVAAALVLRPDGIVLLPRDKERATPDGGLDVAGSENELGRIFEEWRGQNATVGCFVDPVLQQVKAAAGLGADGVELNARVYTAARTPQEREEALDRLSTAALAANKLDLTVSMGGGITYATAPVLARLDRVDEIVAGRSVVARALLIGLEQAVRDMTALVR